MKKETAEREKNKASGREASREQFCNTWKDTFDKGEHRSFHVSFMRGWRHREQWVFPIYTERLNCSFIQIQWHSLLMNIDKKHANQKAHAVIFCCCFTWIPYLKISANMEYVLDLLRDKHNGWIYHCSSDVQRYRIYNNYVSVFFLSSLEKTIPGFLSNFLSWGSFELSGSGLSLTAGQESPSHLSLIWEAPG